MSWQANQANKHTYTHTHTDVDIHEKPLMARQGLDVTMCISTGNPWMPFQNLQPAKTSTKSQPATRPTSGSSALHNLWIAKARTTPPASAPQWCRCHQIKRQGWLNSKITGEENQHQGADRWLPIHLPLTLIRLSDPHHSNTKEILQFIQFQSDQLQPAGNIWQDHSTKVGIVWLAINFFFLLWK